MKIFLAVLTIALVAQVSFAASIQRSERSADDKPSALDVLEEGLKTIIPRLETVANDMPHTAAFKKYRNEFEDIVIMYHTKSRTEFCADKVGKLYEKIAELFDDLKEDKSEEGKKIVEIFQKYRSDKFAEDFKKAMEAAKDPLPMDMLYYC